MLCEFYPTVTSKMLDPTEEETAMSPKPLRATITLVMRSGIDVPAAKKVRPITCNQMKALGTNHAGSFSGSIFTSGGM